MNTSPSAGWHPWPRTLRARMFLILVLGLAVAYGLSFSVLYAERYMSANTVMLGTLESDVATSIAVLDALPPDQRAALTDPLSRGNYRFVLGSGIPGILDGSVHGAEIADTIGEAIGHRLPIRMEAIPGERDRLQAHLTLIDGSPLTIDIAPKPITPLAVWLPYVFVFQMLLIGSLAWLALRQVSLPLAEFATAANALGPVEIGPRLEESGPSEVAHAAKAFNGMRDRIGQYLEERLQILAAISHDLQTPITRMRLRADLTDDTPEKSKLVEDLAELERLVRDGIAYSRSAHDTGEKLARIDIASFVESICYDYQDNGKAVTVVKTLSGSVNTRPQALRRVLTNLMDNALAFGRSAEIEVYQARPNELTISVLDRGPGVPEDQLQAVLQPFFRVEKSRNRDTGAVGLGLAIASQLATAIGGRLCLRNREDGGFAAEVTIPFNATAQG